MTKNLQPGGSVKDLIQQLQECFAGQVCFVGLGNLDYGDDGFGVRLAEKLIDAGIDDVIVAGTTPDRWISHFSRFDHIVFLDAVEFGAIPGSAIFFDAAEIVVRFPQISTHKISLSVLAKWVAMAGSAKAWLLGVQPDSLRNADSLSPDVQRTLEILFQLLCGMKTPEDVSLRPIEEEESVNAC